MCTACPHQLIIVMVRISIDGIIIPYRSLGLVHPVYQHTAARQKSIPLESRLLAILQQEEFVVHWGIDAITRAGG